jgi:electron transfer flavoprotein alpha subunit
MDASPIADVIAIESADTFTRTIYAGICLMCFINLLHLYLGDGVAKVKSSAPVKFMTIRGTAFEPAKTDGGSGKTEKGN